MEQVLECRGPFEGGDWRIWGGRWRKVSVSRFCFGQRWEVHRHKSSCHVCDLMLASIPPPFGWTSVTSTGQKGLVEQVEHKKLHVSALTTRYDTLSFSKTDVPVIRNPNMAQQKRSESAQHGIVLPHLSVGHVRNHPVLNSCHAFSFQERVQGF